MMTSQILKSVHFIKTQKSRYLENETLFFLQMKKFINYTSKSYFIGKNSFVAEVTFNCHALFQWLFFVVFEADQYLPGMS